MSDDEQHIFRAVIETATLLPVLRRDIDQAVTRIAALEGRATDQDRAMAVQFAQTALQERAGDRRWKIAMWIIERFGVPLVAAAAGALAAQKGWLP